MAVTVFLLACSVLKPQDRHRTSGTHIVSRSYHFSVRNFRRHLPCISLIALKGSKAVFSVAEKCKTILASNWQGNLNTIKADSQGSKGEIYTSKVKYFVKKGKPYIWIPEKDLHNVNAIIDERGSFAVASPYPGPLLKILRSMKKQPTRVALIGDVVPLNDEKVQLATESLRETISSEQKVVKESSYSVSGVLSSTNLVSTSRSQNLQELLDGNETYMVYKFNISSCNYVDGSGSSHEVDLEKIRVAKADPLSSFSVSLIDGINQSEARRRALIFFCITYMNKNVKDALMLSVDRKGFDVLGKILGPITNDGSREYQWKEFRFELNEEAKDIESFCQQLVLMEEDALRTVSKFSDI